MTNNNFLQPDVITFTAVMKAYVNKEYGGKKALSILEEMKRQLEYWKSKATSTGTGSTGTGTTSIVATPTNNSFFEGSDRFELINQLDDCIMFESVE